MSQRANILEELRELGSSLGELPVQPVFSVPEGYFDSLPDEILKRIRAMEASDAIEELEILSPALNQISRKMLYAVPPGYFESLNEDLPAILKTPKEEIAGLSPLLAGLEKQMPYSVPTGYFEQIRTEKKIPAKVVSISAHRWFRYAAAAVVTGVIILAGFIYFNSRPDPVEEPYAWVKKSIKKVDRDVLDEFVQLADEEKKVSVSIPVRTEELKELMKDVSDEELQDFLNETPDIESVDEVMMN